MVVLGNIVTGHCTVCGDPKPAALEVADAMLFVSPMTRGAEYLHGYPEHPDGVM